MGDPALDISWILASASDEFLERFREAYGHERRATDLHIFTRAQLMSEIALVRWLVHGIHAEDSSIVNEARSMITDLASDLEGEPLLPSHASSVGSRSSSMGGGASSHPSTCGPGEETLPEGLAKEATAAASGHDSALSRKLAEGEVDPAAPTERLRLGPDGTLIP